MELYYNNIEEQTEHNNHFRQVVFTGKHSQLVIMAIQPGEEIGKEVHEDNDQFFRIEGGQGRAEVAGKTYELADGFALVVPAGVEHNIINTGETPLRLYTIYSPAHHKDGTIHITKGEALKAEAEE